MSLAADLALGDRELVAFTGGGGKTSLLLRLADDLVERAPVLITTTTKVGVDQPGARAVCWSVDEAQAALSDRPDRAVCVFAGADGSKLLGLAPEEVDQIYRQDLASFVLVEADGSRRRPLKAPADHEPVVPGLASLVVVATGIDAVGAPFADAAHRAEQAVRLTGAALDDPITVEDVARILTHPEGGLQGIPETARVTVAITKVDETRRRAAEALRDLLASSQRIERVVLVPRWALGAPDPLVMEAGHLPTPFTAAQIRAGCPEGREIRLSVERAAVSYVRVVRFIEADAAGAVHTSEEFTPDGEPVGEASVVRTTWAELQRHASFPASSTTVRVEELVSRLGRLECRVYQVADGPTVTTFWFAVDRPGMPVRVETRRGGRVTSTMEMVGDSVGQ